MTDNRHQETTPKRVGVISDTHGLLRPEAIAALQNVDLILHAGDIGKPQVLESLREIAPVIAVRGNNDQGAWAEEIPDRETIQVGNVAIYLLHIVKELKSTPPPTNVQVVVSGHSHQPSIAEREGILFLNPGSAGPRRFKLPVSIAHLELRGSDVAARIIDLPVTN